MSMLDVLLRGVKFVYNALGQQMPQEPGLQFVGSVTVTDVPSAGITLIDVGAGGSSSVQPPTVWTHAQGAVFGYPAGVNTWESFDTSGGSITAQLPTSPINGQVAGLKDVGRSLAASPLTLIGSSAFQVEYPPGSFQLASIGYVFNGASSGIDVVWRYYGSYSTWFVEG